MSTVFSKPLGPKRLVFNGRFLTQSATGVQRYAQETLLAIDELLSGPDAPSEWANTRFELAMPTRGRSLPRALRRVEIVELPFLARHGHAWEQVTLAWHARGAFLVGFNYSGPVLKQQQLITIHDAAVRAFPESYSRAYRWLHDALVTVLGRRAARVMTVSEFSRRELAQRYGLPAGQIVVGHEGARHALSQEPASFVEDRFGLQPRGYLLCVGSLKRSKGLDQVAQALQRIPQTGVGELQELKIAIAGAADPRLFPSANGAGDLPADPRIVPLGFVPDEQLFALYRHARGLIIPSRYEGFGLPALEAYINGCPVLAARSASLPEVMGSSAVWFDVDDIAALVQEIERVWTGHTPVTPIGESTTQLLAYEGWNLNARRILGELAASAMDLPDDQPVASPTAAAPSEPGAAPRGLNSHAAP